MAVRSANFMKKIQSNTPLICHLRLVTGTYQHRFRRCMHLQEKIETKPQFQFKEYKSGPCTADNIILQADKYGSSLVECVSCDFEMDKGLAKCMKKAFNHVALLKEKDTKAGEAIAIPHKSCYIYYLVTRERWWDRSCYKYLRLALRDMKEHCQLNDIKDVCMGRLGSGADGLDWMRVREIITDTFKNTDINITAQITR